jgi:hypothetical protein
MVVVFPFLLVSSVIRGFGLNVFHFFRGSSRSQLIWFEIMYDVLLVIIGVVRCEVQTVRLCLCFLFFIEIYQFFCGGLLFQE